MSTKALQEYTLYSKYAHYLPEASRRENWGEQVERMFGMHRRKFSSQLQNEELSNLLDFAEKQVLKKRVLGSQRALQFGGKHIEKHETKIFNCSYLGMEREKGFSEAMYLLLCGCGVGFSVQKHHVDKLSLMSIREGGKKTHVIQDSIEGWADAIGILLASYFEGKGGYEEYKGKKVNFDYSLIRAEGVLIAGQFRAPGPRGLKKSIGLIEGLIENRLSLSKNGVSKLRPIDYYDIVMHMSDAVLSGGVRRSACICLFSKTDTDMLTSKTGSWFVENPQRARANNSVVLVRNETTREEFYNIMDSIKHSGEPGFFFTNDPDKNVGTNPCCEIGLFPYTEDGRAGVSFCNLSEINGKFCDEEEKFYQCCEAAAIIGTFQAGYTNFNYLTKESREIAEREALLGVSITGMMDNAEILFNKRILKKGAEIVKKVNKKVAGLIGINCSARTTCVKPSGSASAVLGTASGVHPQHAKWYIRRVQANKTEFPAQLFQEINPLAVENSVWSANGTDVVISFLCEVPKGAITKNQLTAIEMLDKVKTAQQSWVLEGTNEDLCVNKTAQHNVSNTCFSAKERFMTPGGLESFGEFTDGESVEVYDHNGIRRPAVVKNFGKQKIIELTVTDGETERTIETTTDHIWLGINEKKRTHPSRLDNPTHLEYEMVRTCSLNKILDLKLPKITPFQNNEYYRILSVKETDRIEDVFCIVEPETSTFLLEGGLLTHNCIVKDEEWKDVAKYIYNNRNSFTGVSLLPFSGDKDYAQAPFTTVHSSKELERMYGDAAIFASGLIVDGLNAYDNNLWAACDSILGIGEKLEELSDKPVRPVKNGYSDKKYAEKLIRFLTECEIYDIWFAKKDWARRVNKFAVRYFEGDVRKTCYCLKDVCNRHLWCNLKAEYKEIDWSTVHEPNPHYESADSMGAVACGGGQCEI